MELELDLGLEFDLGVDLDLGIDFDAGLDIDFDAGLDINGNISLETAQAGGSAADYAEVSAETAALDPAATAIDYGVIHELDPGLVDTINAIGASVMAEIFPTDLAVAANLSTPATSVEGFPPSNSAESTPEPEAEVSDFDTETDLELEEELLYYDPSVWELTGSTPESEAATAAPTVDQSAEPAPRPELAEASLTQLLQPGQTAPTSPATDQGDQSQEAFNALLNRRGLSMENASVITKHGLLGGEPFTDTTEYVETSTGLNLVRSTRVFEISGQATTELATTYSLQEYLSAAQPDHVKRRPNLNVHWNEQDYKYEMEWRDNGPQYFPEDVEIPLRQEFQGRWQTEDREAAPDYPILVRDQQQRQLPDDETIFNGVHKSLNRARPQSTQPKITRS